MKYLDLLIILFLLSSISIIISGSAKTYKNLYDKNIKVKDDTEACRFISESFKNTCDGKGFESLYQWQKVCKALWDLKYIGWCDAKDFLPISKEYDKKIIYGKWIGNTGEGEVYWEIKNGK